MTHCRECGIELAIPDLPGDGLCEACHEALYADDDFDYDDTLAVDSPFSEFDLTGEWLG